VRNAKLFRGARFWTTANAPYTLTASGLERRRFSHRLVGLFLGLDHQLGLDFHAYHSIYHRALHRVYRLLRPVVLGFKSHVLQRALTSK